MTTCTPDLEAIGAALKQEWQLSEQEAGEVVMLFFGGQS